MIRLILLVGAGSFFGGICRYLVSLALQGKGLFPVCTMIINLLGCFLIGLVFGLSAKVNISTETRLFLTTGFLGGFTTFSTFSNETFLLLKNAHYFFATAYVLCSVLVGFAATFAGYWAARN